jgi:hypothetical protein
MVVQKEGVVLIICGLQSAHRPAVSNCLDFKHILVADAHRGDGKRFVVHANKRLTAFLEVESAIRAGSIRKKGLVIIRATIVNDLIS